MKKCLNTQKQVLKSDDERYLFNCFSNSQVGTCLDISPVPKVLGPLSTLLHYLQLQYTSLQGGAVHCVNKQTIDCTVNYLHQVNGRIYK